MNWYRWFAWYPVFAFYNDIPNHEYHWACKYIWWKWVERKDNVDSFWGISYNHYRELGSTWV